MWGLIQQGVECQGEFRLRSHSDLIIFLLHARVSTPDVVQNVCPRSIKCIELHSSLECLGVNLSGGVVMYMEHSTVLFYMNGITKPTACFQDGSWFAHGKELVLYGWPFFD